MKHFITFLTLLTLSLPVSAFGPDNIVNHWENTENKLNSDPDYAQRAYIAYKVQHIRDELTTAINRPVRMQCKISSILGQIPIFVLDDKINAIIDFSGGGFKATVIYYFK